jgi:hypothetical protein
MKFKRLSFIFVAVAMVAAAKGGDGVVMQCNFAVNTYGVNIESKGRFKGELPRGCVENFTGWKSASVHTRILEEDGRSFMRFSTDTDVGAQLCLRVDLLVCS